MKIIEDMLELNRIYNEDCLIGLRKLDNNSIDLTVTSPPYDSLRTYTDKKTGEDCEWNFDIFKPIAEELYRVTKPGGIVVWVVGDAVVNGGETGSSFRQALYFQEIGFKIHDTMIYQKNSSSFPARITSKRYSQIFEYMFVFVKGKIRDDIKLIADKRNKWAGWTNWGKHTQYDSGGNLNETQNIKPTPEFSLRTNIWKYSVSFNDKTSHPAVFPEKLAEDCILSWSVEGDIVLDPFMGSGTTAKMAALNRRRFIGFEKQTSYYEESLKRVGKYIGQTNDSVYEIDAIAPYIDEETGEEVTGVTDSLLVNERESIKETEAKWEIWKKLMDELNEYFNDQTVEILKTLKLTFATKSNDEKVKRVLAERGLAQEPIKESVSTVEDLVKPSNDKDLIPFPKDNEITDEKDIERMQPSVIKDILTRLSSLESKVNDIINTEEPNDEPIFVDTYPESLKDAEPIPSTRKRGYTVGTEVIVKRSGIKGVILEYLDVDDLYGVIFDDETEGYLRADEIKRINKRSSHAI